MFPPKAKATVPPFGSGFRAKTSILARYVDESAVCLLYPVVIDFADIGEGSLCRGVSHGFCNDGECYVLTVGYACPRVSSHV